LSKLPKKSYAHLKNAQKAAVEYCFLEPPMLEKMRKNGPFNAMDDWEEHQGQSITLNKYLYGNENPVSGIDSSGNFTLTDIAVSNALQSTVNSFIGDASLEILGAVRNIFGPNEIIDAAISIGNVLQTASMVVSIGAITQVGGYLAYKTIKYAGPRLAGKLGSTRARKFISHWKNGGNSVANNIPSGRRFEGMDELKQFVGSLRSEGYNIEISHDLSRLRPG